jgi:Bacterial Ig-like domain
MAGRRPPTPMDDWDDPELASLFAGDPDLYELSRSLRASRPEPVLGRHFEPYLRARLMDAAAHELRPRGLSRWLQPRAGLLAGGGAALGVAMIAAVVVAIVAHQSGDTTLQLAGTNVAENHQVNPDDVITVSFSQPVDHTSVERNLQIQPATAVQTRWEGNTLVITPVHHLAANTPYTVTIPHTAVRSQSGGEVARADIHITFGTRSTPSPGPTAQPVVTPTLSPSPLGPVSPDTQLLFGPDGSVVATHGLTTTQPSPSPSPTAGSTSGLLPSLPATPTLRGLPIPLPATTGAASATPAPGASSTSRLLRLAADGSGGSTLGPSSTAAAFSPSGASLSYLVRRNSTQADLWVASADGSHAVRLVRNADLGSPLAWSDESDLIYLSGGQVTSVDLQGRPRPVGGSLRVAPGQDVAFSPSGQVVYVGPAPSSAQGSPSASPASGSSATPAPTPSASASASGSAGASPSATADSTGRLVVLATGATQALHGVTGMPAFSGDGARVAWVDAGGSIPLLEWIPTSGDSSATPTVITTSAAAGDSISTLALSGDGSRVVYTLSHDGATPQVRVLTVASGAAVAVGDGQPVASPVFSAHGDRVAFVRTASDGTAQAEIATIPGAGASATPAPDAVPSDAAGVLDRFVAAQLQKGDPGTLHSLAAAAASLAPNLGIAEATRSYVIKSTFDTASGTVTAQVRLVRDASQTAGVSFADETITLARDPATQAFQVTAATLSDFRTEPVGPQIVHLSSERQQSALVLRLAFDSDLDPATVTTAAINMVGPHGSAVPVLVRYDVESRTVVVTIPDAPPDVLTLVVSGALHDIAGQPLPSAYSTTVQG